MFFEKESSVLKVFHCPSRLHSFNDQHFHTNKCTGFSKVHTFEFQDLRKAIFVFINFRIFYEINQKLIFGNRGIQKWVLVKTLICYLKLYNYIAAITYVFYCTLFRIEIVFRIGNLFNRRICANKKEETW